MALSKKDQARQDRFYEGLAECLDDFGGFCELPRPDRWDHYKGLFHIARQAHIARPDENHKNWICVFNRQAQYIMALPEEICPEQLVSLEKVHKHLEKAKARIRRHCIRLEAEYGKFEVERVQGRIFIRHIGAIPIGNNSEH